MGGILEIVAPVFAIIGFGYLAARRRWVDEAGFRTLIWFTFTISLPALLFLGGTSGHQVGGGAAVAFFVAALAVYGLAMALAGWMRMPPGEAGLFALNSAYGNTVMMGIPLVAAAFGQAGLSVLLTIIALHSMVLLTLGTVVVEYGIHRHAPLKRLLRGTAEGLLHNPIVMAVMLALAWHLLGLPPPAGVVRRVLEMFGAASSSLALFCLGGSLLGFRMAGAMGEVAWSVVLKLAVLPLAVWGLCHAMALTPLETAVAVVSAALPTGANAFMLARRYQAGADRSGATVLVSTMISVGTLAALLAWFKG